MKKSNRRGFLETGITATAAGAVIGNVVAQPAKAADNKPVKKVIWEDGKRPERTPLFSSTVTFGNLVFIAGAGAHFPGDIKTHTKHVLETIKTQLEAAGSSMEKVLKCNVYLVDLKDFPGMNEMFLGSFGPEPPVRTTVAVAGLPGNSLVEIDVIASL